MGNQNAILIECVLIGLYEGNSRTKQKEKKKSKRKKIYTRRKVQSDPDDQYFTLHILVYLKHEKLQSNHYCFTNNNIKTHIHD